MPMPGPIGLMMRRKAAMQRPPMMEEDPMSVMPPDIGGDMDFPQGDMDYEQQDQRLAQPQLVHSTPEMQGEYKRMGFRGVTPEAQDLTNGVEQMPPGPIREKFHAAQHQRLKSDQGNVNQMARMKLAQQKAQLEELFLEKQRLGDLKGAAMIQQTLQGLGSQYEAAIRAAGGQ